MLSGGERSVIGTTLALLEPTRFIYGSPLYRATNVRAIDCEVDLNTILSPEKIKRAILGGGLGIGFGMIGVALIAIGSSRANGPEPFTKEVLAILLGGFAGLALGWLSGRPAAASCAGGRTGQQHHHRRLLATKSTKT
jgi:hypothetical protein